MINFLVYNAALSYIGPFLDNAILDHIQITNVNMITPMKMSSSFWKQDGERKKRRDRAEISLIAGNQGSVSATYAATKAFNRILAESIWYEWKNKGVDVIEFCATAH